MNLSKLSHIEILKLTKACFALVLCFAISSEATALQCKDLFSKHIEMTADNFSQAIDSLAGLYIQIELNQLSVELKPQAIKDLNKQLTLLKQFNPLSTELFKNKVAELLSEARKKDIQNREKSEKKEKERNEIANRYAPIGIEQKAIFHEIEPGKFVVGRLKTDAEITEKYAMMSTAVTQRMWAIVKILINEKDLAKINPSSYMNFDPKVDVTIEGISLSMQPERPVVNVSWIDVNNFVHDLNYLSNLDDVIIQKHLQNMIPGHIKGDIYDMPDELQWRFVMQNRGQNNQQFFDRDDDSELSLYAWNRSNSEAKTHDVGQLKPRMIDGKPFYDLEGNVFELVKKKFEPNIVGHHLNGMLKTLGGNLNFSSMARALGWHYYSSETSDFDLSLPTDHPEKSVGFRLIRTRP